MFPHQTARFLQNHVSEDDSVFLIQLPQMVQEQADQDALRMLLPGRFEPLDARAVNPKPAGSVDGIPAQAFGLPFLLLLNTRF